MKRYFSAVTAVLLLIVFIAGADIAREGAKAGLALSFHMAVPALFPFFIAGTLLTDTGVTAWLGRACGWLMWKLYGLPGQAASAIILGFTGGYPIGVQAAADLYTAGQLNRAQAQRLLGFCNNTGPAFIIGVCGAGVFGSVRVGLILYFLHIVSALLTGLALTTAGHGKGESYQPPAPAGSLPFPAALVHACERAAQSSIKIAAFITLFSILSALLEQSGILRLLTDCLTPAALRIGIPAEGISPFLLGGMELTRGLAILPEAGLPYRLALPLASGLLAFGGLSVWCQSLSLAAASGLSLKRCFVGKTLHAAIATALTVFWCAAMPGAVPAFAPGQAPVFPFGMKVIPLIIMGFYMAFRACHAQFYANQSISR